MFVGGCVVVVIVVVIGAVALQAHHYDVTDGMERDLIRVERDPAAFAAAVEQHLDQAKSFWRRVCLRNALVHIHAKEKLVRLAEQEQDVRTTRRYYDLAIRVSDIERD